MKLNIEVTEKFIKQGHRGCAVTCPIALAVEEAFCRRTKSVSFGVIAHYCGIGIVNHTKRGRVFYSTKLPKKLVAFMTAFDDSPNKINTPPPVKPFKFTLNLKREKYALEKHASLS